MHIIRELKTQTTMKNSISLPAVAVALLLTFSSCMKEGISEPASISQTVSSNATAPDLSKCKLRRIYQLYSPSTRASALFSYNKAGNPYSVLYSNSGTGVPDHYFIYDAQNRLKEYRLQWAFYLHEVHYYRHNAQNQIIIDSALYSDANGSYPYSTLSTFDYDAMGRIVKETIVNIKNTGHPLDPTRRPTFTYDNRGNLAVAGWKSSSYDNKINPLRQSPVFQFIHRNYSMNNAAVQTKYNSIGLPLIMKPNNDSFFNMTETEQLIYDCQ